MSQDNAENTDEMVLFRNKRIALRTSVSVFAILGVTALAVGLLFIPVVGPALITAAITAAAFAGVTLAAGAIPFVVGGIIAALGLVTATIVNGVITSRINRANRANRAISQKESNNTRLYNTSLNSIVENNTTFLLRVNHVSDKEFAVYSDRTLRLMKQTKNNKHYFEWNEHTKILTYRENPHWDIQSKKITDNKSIEVIEGIFPKLIESKSDRAMVTKDNNIPRSLTAFFQPEKTPSHTGLFSKNASSDDLNTPPPMPSNQDL